MESWENAPLVAFARKFIMLEVFVERFEKDCHERLIRILGEFCEKDSTSNRSDVVTQYLHAYDLDRYEGGIGFAPLTDDLASKLASIHPAYGKTASVYDGFCCLRYVPHPWGGKPCYTKPVNLYDETSPPVVQFAIGQMVPLRLVLELYRIFDTSEARNKIGCGQTRISARRTNIADNVCIPVPIGRLLPDMFQRGR
jgi:hypothetical protein